MAKEVPCSIYRGGNSKSLIFKDDDLPVSQEERDQMFLYAVGCPDPQRLNGLGGTTINQNKIATVKASSMEGVDIEYDVGEISVHEPHIEYSYNSGNVAFSVPLFAYHNGMLPRKHEDQAFSLYNINTKEKIVARFMNFDKEPGGAEIQLDFLHPGGGVTGTLFPTKTLTNRIHVQNKTFEVTVIDAGNLTVFVNATELGLQGTETTDGEVNHVIDTLIMIGEEIAGELNLNKSFVKTMIVAKPQSYIGRSGQAVAGEDIHICARDITLRSLHTAFPATGAVALSIASLVPGTIPNQLAAIGETNVVKIGHPSGISEVGATVSINNGDIKAQKITLVNSSRCLMHGKVWVP